MAPGPRLVVAASYSWSPVGPYLEVAVAEPARACLRPGLRVTTMAVDSPGSCEAGRRYWGFPKELATLEWEHDGGQRLLRWEEQGLEVKATPVGPRVPLVLPGWAIQQQGDSPVAVPLRLRGKARLARVQLVSRPGGPFSYLEGRRQGAIITTSTLVVGPSRRSWLFWSRTGSGHVRGEQGIDAALRRGGRERP